MSKDNKSKCVDWAMRDGSPEDVIEVVARTYDQNPSATFAPCPLVHLLGLIRGDDPMNRDPPFDALAMAVDGTLIHLRVVVTRIERIEERQESSNRRYEELQAALSSLAARVEGVETRQREEIRSTLDELKRKMKALTGADGDVEKREKT